MKKWSIDLAISVRFVTDESEFESLKDKWNDLLQHSSSDNIFLTWEWLYTWWQEYKNGKTLLIILLEEDGQLVGIAPLCLTRVIYFGLRPLNHVEFIGGTGTCSEYLDFIFANDKESYLLEALITALYAMPQKSWDVLNFVSICSDSSNLRFLREYINKHHYRNRIYNTFSSPYISLPDSMEAFLQTLSGKTRWKYRHHKNKLFKEGSVAIVTANKKDDLDSSFNQFLALHDKRWENRENNGSFSEGRTKYLSFHRKIVKLFFEKQWLSLTFLTFNDIKTAAQYNYIYANKVYYHSACFDPAWGKQNVAGVLQYIALENAIKSNLKEFDFLRGTEEYKFNWTKTTRKSIDIVIWRSKTACNLAIAEKALRKAAGFLLPKTVLLSLYEHFLGRKEDRE